MNTISLLCRSLKLVIIAALVFCSCTKKLDVKYTQPAPPNTFFHSETALSPEQERIRFLLETANRKTGFVDKLADSSGHPIWEKILFAGKLVAPSSGTVQVMGRLSTTPASRSSTISLVMPMTKDDEYLSSIIIASILPDTTIKWDCITNHELYLRITNPSMPRQKAEELMALFMYMDNVCNYSTLFKNIPEYLFPTSQTHSINGKKWLPFQIMSKAPRPFEKVVSCVGKYIIINMRVKTSSTCDCSQAAQEQGRCDWQSGCPSGNCYDDLEYEIDMGDDCSSGGAPDVDFSATPTYAPPSPPTGGTGIDYVDPCAGTWYNPAPCGDLNFAFVEDYYPDEETLFYFDSKAAIDINKYLKCFDNVPETGAVYSVKLNVSIPSDNEPNRMLAGGSPGHVFLTITKTNGSASVSQSFGFYPSSGPVSMTMYAVGSELRDDGAHKINGSISMDNIGAANFATLKSKILQKVSEDYDLNDYNCGNFALDVFNSIRPMNPVKPPKTKIIFPATMFPPIKASITFSCTPNSTLKYLQAFNGIDPTVSIGVTTSPTSHGPCN